MWSFLLLTICAEHSADLGSEKRLEEGHTRQTRQTLLQPWTGYHTAVVASYFFGEVLRVLDASVDFLGA